MSCLTGTRILLVATLAASACSPAMTRRVNGVALAASTAMLVWDAHQTLGQANEGWVRFHESNPIMGTSPSPGSVAIYFSTAIVINTVAWLLTPPKYRAVLPAVVTAVQTADELFSWYAPWGPGTPGL